MTDGGEARARWAAAGLDADGLAPLERGIWTRAEAIAAGQHLRRFMHALGRSLIVLRVRDGDPAGRGYALITDLQLVGALQYLGPDRVEWTSTGGDWQTGASPAGEGHA